MFRRGNLASKYREFAKSLKSLKSNLSESDVSTKAVAKCEEVLQTLKTHKISHTQVIEKYRKTLTVVQSKVGAFTSDNEESRWKELQSRLSLSNATKRNIFTTGAIGVFSSNATPVSVTGYNDTDFYKQLGITNPVQSNVSVATNNNNITTNNDESVNVDVLPVENCYTSIFDNMPPESARNDIYTSITNVFAKENVFDGQNVEMSVYGGGGGGKDVIYFSSPDASVIANNEPADSVVDEITNPGIDQSVLQATNVTNSPIDTAVEVLPEAPVVPDVAAQIVSQLNALGEPTFASQGLGGWTPVGIVQNCFEYLHGSLGIPWWEAIAIGTLVIRFCLFPLVIMAQRNAAKMNNNMPQMQVIQLKMTEARQSGNQLEVARYSQELMTFMKEKNMNPFKNMIVPLAQMPVFVSFFMGLREMANVPLDSMRTGGLFWFTDLTVPDQFFILPIITSATLWATVELGTDSAKLSAQNMQTMKYVLRALPIVILPFTVNFPGAILCYWMASNFISLAQVGFLRIPAVRTYFDIDALLTHNPKNLPIKSKGFVGGIKDSWTNIKITKELEERRRLDEMQFQRAGKGPLVKTYKYDPTKQAPKVAAKNR